MLSSSQTRRSSCVGTWSSASPWSLPCAPSPSTCSLTSTRCVTQALTFHCLCSGRHIRFCHSSISLPCNVTSLYLSFAYRDHMITTHWHCLSPPRPLSPSVVLQFHTVGRKPGADNSDPQDLQEAQEASRHWLEQVASAGLLFHFQSLLSPNLVSQRSSFSSQLIRFQSLSLLLFLFVTIWRL